MNDTYDDIEPGDDNLDENCANEEKFHCALLPPDRPNQRASAVCIVVS